MARPVEERFLAYLDQRGSDECWPWTKSGNGLGYGLIALGKEHRWKQVLAHRFSYEFFVGEIPQGMFVLHRCDNPPCCNPKHLFLGTQLDNIRDAKHKGRLNTSGLQKDRLMKCRKGLHELTAENVYVYPNGDRKCRKCRDEYRRAHYLRSLESDVG